MSVNCEYFRALMSQSLDRDLLDAEKEALKEHTRTCSECRRVYGAMSAVSLSLRDDEEEVPDGFSDSVMARIRAYEEERAHEETASGETGEEPRVVPVRSRRAAPVRHKMWPQVAIAACLVAVIGFGAAKTMLTRANKSSGEVVMEESVQFSAPSKQEAAADGEQSFYAAGAAEEAVAAESESAVLNEEFEEAALDSVPEADTAVAQNSSSAPVPEPETPLYTRDSPASVPPGKEADFEALIQASRWGDAGAPAADWEVIAAVEYKGIIYEFLTDEPQEEYLLWKDAAESVDPILSPCSVSDLRDFLS